VVSSFEEHLELLRIIRERLDNVVDILEETLAIVGNDAQGIIIRDKLEEALIALQGPKKSSNDGNHD
jgi:hypothetical protein